MPRSLANGDYTLLAAIESSSTAQSFYRVCQSRADGSLSCDCPRWTLRPDAQGRRSCKHTLAMQPLVAAAPTTALTTMTVSSVDPLIHATRMQWPGLNGVWGLDQRVSRIDGIRYQFTLITLQTGNGDTVSGLVALCDLHGAATQTEQQTIAAWAGYAIAVEVCRRANLPLRQMPPAHFTITRRQTATTTSRSARAPQIGFADILRIGDQVDLGDGLTPYVRAENTLKLFLGDMFTTLQRQGFLDVSSRKFPQRVYRLRWDNNPVRQQRHERRVRVFERGEYVKDFCIVRNQDCPADDHFLTMFLGFITDEEGTLSVVHPTYNVFRTNSDGQGPARETISAVWQPALAA